MARQGLKRMSVGERLRQPYRSSDPLSGPSKEELRRQSEQAIAEFQRRQAQQAHTTPKDKKSKLKGK
jgi:hypothetical protein